MKNHLRSGLAWVVVAILLGSPLACSFSNSSESSSDSSTSSSKSSTSSSGKEEAARFREDVERYTAAFVKSWRPVASAPDRQAAQGEHGFYAGLGDLSRKHGVSDWEAEPGVWESIGRGLAQAEVGDAERRAYVQAWANGDSERQIALERGSEASR